MVGMPVCTFTRLSHGPTRYASSTQPSHLPSHYSIPFHSPISYLWRIFECENKGRTWHISARARAIVPRLNLPDALVPCQVERETALGPCLKLASEPFRGIYGPKCRQPQILIHGMCPFEHARLVAKASSSNSITLPSVRMMLLKHTRGDC